MENLMNASVYVGTYGKYNSGSIAGKWIMFLYTKVKRNS